MDTTELQDRLHRIAERAAPAAQDPARLVRTVAARHRAQRRQRLGVGAVVLAVVAVVAVVPAVLAGGAAPAPPASTTTLAPVADVLTAPTRGSLAGDAAFVEAVRRLPWTEAADPDAPTAQDEPALGSRHVVFAGDVPGGRWALVAGEGTAGTQGDAVMWFVAPAGAAADRLQPAQLSTGQDPGIPVALTDADTGTLVVVSAPGDAVAVSPRPDVAADGTVSRQWQRVDAPDGVAVLALPPAAGTYDEALRYRVTRGGAEVATAMPAGHRAGDRTVPGVPLDWLRGGPGSPAAAAVLSGGIDHVLEITGLSPDQVRFRVVWAGDVPAAAGGAGRLQLLSATLPSGAVYLEALLGPDTGGAGATAGTWCGADLRPAGPPLSEQLFVLACSGLSGGGSEPTDQLVLVGPPAATTAQLLDGNGTELARTPLTDGVGVLRAPGDLRVVEFLAAERTSLGSAQPLGYGGLADLTGTGGD